MSQEIDPKKPTLPTVADDYGISDYVNDCILNDFTKQKVHIISVLPNFVSKRDITRLQKHLPPNQASIHISLVRGIALSSPMEIPTLVDGHQEFHWTVTFLILMALKKINLDHIRLEVTRQIESLINQGYTPVYLDSEQHTHVFIPVWNVITEVAKKYQIKSIRSPWSSFNYLKKKPLKFLTLVFFQAIFYLQYGPAKKYPMHHTLIAHPGTNFDTSWH